MFAIFASLSENLQKLEEWKKDSIFHYEIFHNFAEYKDFVESFKDSFLVLILIDDIPMDWVRIAESLGSVKKQSVFLQKILFASSKKEMDYSAKYYDQCIVSELDQKKLNNIFRATNQEYKKHIEKKPLELNQLSSLEQEFIGSSNIPKYLLSKTYIDIPAYFESIRETIDSKELRSIYLAMRKHLVFPGKKVISKFSKDPYMYAYNENYFQLDMAEDELLSKRLGFVVLKNKELLFFPIVSISPDKMQAESFLFAIEGFKISHLKSMFDAEIKLSGISRGFLYDNIHFFFERKVKQNYIGWIKIASGKPAVNGHNSYVQFIKELRQDPGKVVDVLGRMDFRERENILRVQKGEAVAVLIDELLQEDGYTIDGKEIKARFLKKQPLKIGENLSLNPKTNEYCALVDGMVVLTSQFLSVKEIWEIEGDVDLNLGNIHYENSVSVKGDILSGMVVECGGNLVVQGVIENAKINVGGDLICKGIVGCGDQPVIVKGEVFIDFIENSSLESIKSIHIKKDCINSKLKTTEMIYSEDKAKIFGGELYASAGMELNSVGNVDFIETKIFLGGNFYLERKMAEVSKGIKQIRSKMKEDVKEVSRYLDWNRDLQAQLSRLPKVVAERVNEQITELKTLKEEEERFNLIYDKVKASLQKEMNSYLLVENKAYQNVTVFVVGVSRKLKEDYQSVIFFLDPKEGEVKESSLKE